MGNISRRLICSSPGAMEPLVFVCGATGTGKTELAVALSRRFSGELINADAMQLYKGLDIVTNKATIDEQQGVTHHMVNVLEPDSLSYTIHEYKRQAQSVIKELMQNKKLPVVVGGTNYYVDALLWESLIPSHETSETSARNLPKEMPSDATTSFIQATEDDVQDFSLISADNINHLIQDIDTNHLRTNIDKIRCHKLHSLLMCIDPDTAKSLHPNAVRKVIRAIEVYKHHGKAQSSFIAELNGQSHGQVRSAPLSYNNAIVLWLSCTQTVLDDRLDKRVDKMIERGLIKELDQFHSAHNKRMLDPSLDNNHGGYTKGIFQCIGFKEFHNYLMLSNDERQADSGRLLFEQGILDMKTATRRYARYQNKWFRKRFIEKRNTSSIPPIYTLDASDKERFYENVIQPAVSIVEKLLDKPQQLVDSLSGDGFVPTSQITGEDNPVVYKTCEACGTLCVRKVEWDSHSTSKKHHKRVASLKRQKGAAYENLSKTLTNYKDQQEHSSFKKLKTVDKDIEASSISS